MSQKAPKESLPKAYEFKEVEERWYKIWLEKGFFTAQTDPERPCFSMVIPPPNVTGVLHIGHALNNTLQDILARYKRMDGYNTLWVPGTDHAGIATQNVVERQLLEEGLSRHDLGREGFIERVWKWKEESGGRIIEQLKRLGCSCDWSRERFTMDEGLSRAVREVFVRLYEEGLIYKGDYIINWCPRCHTALADIEVEHEPREGRLWHIRYALKNGDGWVVVATTRPETMLGDTAVAVNPDDPRYADLVGKELVLPLMNRLIPIIGDEAVEMEFGTGAVKVTPAHDFNDFEMARRHGLPSVNIFDENAVLTDEAGAYKGLDRYEARKRVIADLEALGLLEKEEPHSHAVGECYRCGTVVEPRLSKQWFVRTKPLAKKALEAVKDGETMILPESWFKTYEEWMTNIRDWCISRQIWWGHRIPAWTCQECGKIIVSRIAPKACPDCPGSSLLQESDVLDTWFSSALWPFSTLGWPEDTEDLKAFYPTSVLITSFDILFFWVARMMMMGIHFMGKAPFRYVYLHALVRDAQGHKMSKSRGNVIDPLTVMERYGTDAVRFTLAALAAQGRDIKLAEDRIEGYRHFVNKIWNASRLLFMNLEEKEVGKGPLTPVSLSERWILSRLNSLISTIRSSLDSFNFDVAAREIYSFFWHEFCDWHLEFSKFAFSSEDASKRKQAIDVSMHVLSSCLKLLHPIMPFVTEEIWNRMPGANKGYIMTSSFPKPDPLLDDPASEEKISKLISIISGIRNIRAELGVHPGAKIKIMVLSHDEEITSLIKDQAPYIKILAKVDEIVYLKGAEEKPEGTAPLIFSDIEIFIPLKGLIDISEEIGKLEKERKKVTRDLEKTNAKLSNRDFLSKAPGHIVEKEKERLSQLTSCMEKIDGNIAILKGLIK